MSEACRTAVALACGRFRLALDRPLVMGVINVTPDSFSERGKTASANEAIERARRLAGEGADILDIGAESTRPGAAPVSVAIELARLVPVLTAALELGLPVSVDTRRPEVMRAVLAAGADMINDVAGFRAPGAIEAVAGSAAALCAMHMRGEPATMQDGPVYRDVVRDVRDFLFARANALYAAGVARDRIVLDPGIGFGKTLEDNLRLLRAIERLAALGYPVLVGVSRKSMIGQLTGRGVEDRLAGSLGAALAAVARGARIVRVHDVAQTRDALAVWQAVGAQP
ncbi:MAG: dihydropteroate synthase [Burkholderiaceae bacterium]|nr:dihydropteroate synthase [Burkholderiaceae bacterium]